MKNSFLLYANYGQQVELLTMEQRGQLLTALLHYASGIPAGDCCSGYDGMVMMAFSFIRAQIDRDSGEYEKKCEKNRENARKRWEAEKNEKTSRRGKSANASKRMRSHTNAENAMHNDNDIDNDLKENTHYVSAKEKPADASAQGEALSEEADNDVFTPPAVDEVEKYAAEYGGQIDARRFVDYYQSINWKVGGNPITDWKAAARNWMHNQAPPKPKPAAVINKFQNFQQRDMDYNAIVDKLASG